MRYNPSGYQGVPNQREFRAAATGRPLQWARSDRPAALAAYLNVAFRSMLTPCRVGSAVPSSARGIDGGPRRITEVVLNEQPQPVAWRSHDGIPRCVQLVECYLRTSGRTAGIREPGRYQARGRFPPRVPASIM